MDLMTTPLNFFSFNYLKCIFEFHDLTLLNHVIDVIMAISKLAQLLDTLFAKFSL